MRGFSFKESARIGSDAGGSAVSVLYLHQGFLSFLADWAYRDLENIGKFDEWGRPTPAASTIPRPAR
jgi:hypothetical protein